MLGFFSRRKVIKEDAKHIAELVLFLQDYLSQDADAFVAAARKRGMKIEDDYKKYLSGRMGAGGFRFIEENNPKFAWDYIQLHANQCSLMVSGHEEYYGTSVSAFPKNDGANIIQVRFEAPVMVKAGMANIGKNARALYKAFLEFPSFEDLVSKVWGKPLL